MGPDLPLSHGVEEPKAVGHEPVRDSGPGSGFQRM